MPSAFQDKHGWIADFRGYKMRGSQRRRVRIHDDSNPKEYADRCEQICRLLEKVPTEHLVLEAEQLRAITTEQAQALLKGEAVFATPRKPLRELRITEAADLHPSTRRESESRPRDYDQRMRYLDKFKAWAGIKHAREITLDLVQRWVVELRRQEYAWETRRHHLAYIRRATKIAASYGIPDPLSGFRLDHNDEYRPVNAWPLETIKAALEHLEDERCRAIIGLGLGMGLRPSEIARVASNDIKDGILTVGARKRKNRASIRRLPMPVIVIEWTAPLINSDAPLIRGHHRSKKRNGCAFSLENLGTWWKETLSEAKDDDGNRLVPHATIAQLRKTFVAILDEGGISSRLIDAYMGHAVRGFSAVTQGHYLPKTGIDRLRPVADFMDGFLRDLSTRDKALK